MRWQARLPIGGQAVWGYTNLWRPDCDCTNSSSLLLYAAVCVHRLTNSIAVFVRGCFAHDQVTQVLWMPARSSARPMQDAAPLISTQRDTKPRILPTRGATLTAKLVWHCHRLRTCQMAQLQPTSLLKVRGKSTPALFAMQRGGVGRPFTGRGQGKGEGRQETRTRTRTRHPASPNWFRRARVLPRWMSWS